jgi:tetratricopeptide (TPR) repeat protein
MPDNLGLRYGLASAYVHARDRASAIGEFKKVIALAPQWVEAQYSLGVLYSVENDLEIAQKHLTAALALNPGLVSARRYLASVLARQGKLTDAIAEYEQLVKLDSGGKDRDALALLYVMTGSSFQQCIGLMERGTRETERTVLRDFLVAYCYGKTDQEARMKELFSKISSLDASNLSDFMENLLFVDEKQAADTLIPILEKGAESGAKPAVCYLLVGELRVATEDNEGAVQAFKRALAAEPKNAVTHFELGSLYEQMKQYDAAKAELKECLAIDPNNAKACNYLGYIYAEQGENLGEAENLIKNALQAEPQNGYYLDSLAWVYYKLGDAAKAIEFLMSAVINLDHDDPIVREHLGDAYFAKGNLDKAIIEWQKAVRLDPKNEKLKEKLMKHPPQKGDNIPIQQLEVPQPEGVPPHPQEGSS